MTNSWDVLAALPAAPIGLEWRTAASGIRIRLNLRTRQFPLVDLGLLRAGQLNPRMSLGSGQSVTSIAGGSKVSSTVSLGWETERAPWCLHRLAGL
ncbi:hypothetical protein UY3_09400 [Chelonia mydas]|uniref:Uncharacterized protein n=1 Tax=Chelonia mydas TaxID=8469 RepID=M7BZ94_CHEMY|nr:hypothetical protein UY3_09400 [Chelonia mydas]